MRHNRAQVIKRVTREFDKLDALVANLTDEDWKRRLPRPESKDPWTVKDALAHITFWKANAARVARREPVPPEERGLTTTEGNHLVYLRWHKRSPKDVLNWHRQVQQDVLAALRAAPDSYFNGRERGPDWPGDLDSHSAAHRVNDIEHVVKNDPK